MSSNNIYDPIANTVIKWGQNLLCLNITLISVKILHLQHSDTRYLFPVLVILTKITKLNARA
jgi:hypothetical protein